MFDYECLLKYDIFSKPCNSYAVSTGSSYIRNFLDISSQVKEMIWRLVPSSHQILSGGSAKNILCLLADTSEKGGSWCLHKGTELWKVWETLGVSDPRRVLEYATFFSAQVNVSDPARSYKKNMFNNNCLPVATSKILSEQKIQTRLQFICLWKHLFPVCQQSLKS